MDAKARMQPLKRTLEDRTARGELWAPERDGIRCFACGHRCFIPEGFDGICKVRSNRQGELRVPWGYVAGLQVDPIEKKPFFHVTPGANALSFGMLGCDYHCSYCQNWFTSQVLRDPEAMARPEEVTPDEVAGLAVSHGARMVTSTYNEPLITSEWAVAIFKHAKAQKLMTSYVSNGNATSQVLDYIRPYVDCYKIDLKSFDDKHYRKLGGVLATVLESIRRVYQMGFFLELVTLLIPGFNDSPEEIKRMTEFIASVSPDIPWHATAFHKDYKMTSPDNTSVDTLLRSAEIAKKQGLRYVYLGNLPGHVGKWENTYCGHCKGELVVRRGFTVLSNRMKTNHCPDCGKLVPGLW